jgi:hypothetical protein
MAALRIEPQSQRSRSGAAIPLPQSGEIEHGCFPQVISLAARDCAGHVGERIGAAGARVNIGGFGRLRERG